MCFFVWALVSALVTESYILYANERYGNYLTKLLYLIGPSRILLLLACVFI